MTISYEELVARIGQPTAVRAVASANVQNRVNFLNPCHRVIGTNGELTCYGGGLWRSGCCWSENALARIELS